MGPDIEGQRLPVEESRVFSYRFRPEMEHANLFDRSIGWSAFHTQAIALASNHPFVISTDISDFYPRVYHHRIENSLRRATRNTEAARRCTRLLSSLAIGGVSYGLPIGGNAARLLAELVLDRTDRLLRQAKIEFCRFVDDYYIFGNSEQDVRTALACLAECLSAHEGLALQRSKTRLMSSEEFLKTSPLSLPGRADSQDELQAHEFLKIRLRYDPYSPTADADFERLKSELDRIDIVGMLARELRKTRIDETLVRQLIKSLRFLDVQLRNGAIDSLVDNLGILYPLFPTVALVIRALISDLSAETRTKVFHRIRSEINRDSHIFRVPANILFALRLLADDESEDSDAILTRLFQDASLPSAIRRDIISCKARRRNEHWTADRIRRPVPGSPWERRALMAASYILGDEGSHYRSRVTSGAHAVDRAFIEWVGSRNSGRIWEVPI